MTLNDSDISIVVQGPILFESSNKITRHTTKLVCQRIRQLFPTSELILSTWYQQEVTGIAHDKLIRSIDPGATWFNYENYT